MPGRRYGRKALPTHPRKLIGSRRRAPSDDLLGAVEEIVAMARPELDADQRERAAGVIAADVRPGARMVSLTDVRRVQARVAHAIQGSEAAVSGQSRLTR